MFTKYSEIYKMVNNDINVNVTLLYTAVFENLILIEEMGTLLRYQLTYQIEK